MAPWRSEMAPFSFSIWTLCCFLSAVNTIWSAMPAGTPDHVQLQALMAFRDSIKEDPGGALAGWTPEAHHCSWPGITCDVDPSNTTSILSISLSGNQLGGSISPVVGNISTLQDLDLSFNSFTGTIPSSISNCTSLWKLDLGGNKLTGEIPMALGKLKNLQTLYLRDNSFTGSIPSSISNCTSLLALDLSSNKLTGGIPPQLGELTNLMALNILSNHLSGEIPAELGELKKLERLYLLDNSLTGSIPSSISNCTSLLNLYLSSNNLTGKIPLGLGRLQYLTEFYAMENQMSGEIPDDLFNCTALNRLDLSRNNFTGILEPEIGKLSKLWELELHENSFYGQIPVAIAELKQLQYLDLSRNRFQGEIPWGLGNLTGLRSLDLSFNQLRGPVPQGGIFEYLEPSRLQGNPALCGAKINATCPSRGHHRFSKKAVIVAAGLSSSLGSFFLSLLAITVRNRCHVSASPEDNIKDLEAKLATTAQGLKRFTKTDLEIATNCFSEFNVIGRSDLSIIYGGRLLQEDGRRLVAVKKLNLQQFPSETSDKSFLTELKILGCLKHRNLVKVVGYAWESGKLKALVLEMMKNGSLEIAIHNAGLYRSSRWDKVAERLRVCISVANGLAYLHTGYHFPIIHCDLKPSNILLDHEWEAHIGDFGIARMLNVHLSNGSRVSTTTAFQGTIGYLAPEFAYMRKVTAKVDVFSFGVVIMEFITGRRPTAVTKDDGQPLSLPEFVAEALAAGVDRVLQVLDPNMNLTSSEDVQVAVKLLELASRCTRADPDMRPDMNNVLSSLLKLREENWLCC